MSDLISRSALIEEIKNKMPQGSVRGVFLALVEDIPTAYDVSKVVAELEELKEKSLSSYAYDEIKTAIDIVRKGGVE